MHSFQMLDQMAGEGSKRVPKTSEMRESKFLKQGDVGNGTLLTVRSCEPHNVAKEGAEPENKWCLSFEESDKPLVLNSINIQLCERIFASDDTDDWVGKRIVLYTDPTISFQGKVTGGIRVRAPKQQNQAPAKAKQTLPPADPDMTADEVPF
jgi:hypothetical protein